MIYKQKLKNLQFKVVNSLLSDKAIELGNKTVITSAFLILLSLNFLKIDTIEVQGVAISMRAEIIALVLLIVNIYFFKQFNSVVEIDKNSFIYPEDYQKFHTELENSLKPIINLQTELMEEHAILKTKAQQNNLSELEYNDILNKALNLDQKISDTQEIIDQSDIALNKDFITAKKFLDTIKVHNKLNISFPKWMYWVSLSMIILRFTIDTIIIFNTEKKPWTYLLEREIGIIEAIYKKDQK